MILDCRCFGIVYAGWYPTYASTLDAYRLDGELHLAVSRLRIIITPRKWAPRKDTRRVYKEPDKTTASG